MTPLCTIYRRKYFTIEIFANILKNSLRTPLKNEVTLSLYIDIFEENFSLKDNQSVRYFRMYLCMMLLLT